MSTSMSSSVLLNISHPMPWVTRATSSVPPASPDRPGMFPMSSSPLSRLIDPLEGGQCLPFDGAAKQLQLSRVPTTRSCFDVHSFLFFDVHLRRAVSR